MCLMSLLSVRKAFITLLAEGFNEIFPRVHFSNFMLHVTAVLSCELVIFELR